MSPLKFAPLSVYITTITTDPPVAHWTAMGSQLLTSRKRVMQIVTTSIQNSKISNPAAALSSGSLPFSTGNATTQWRGHTSHAAPLMVRSAILVLAAAQPKGSADDDLVDPPKCCKIYIYLQKLTIHRHGELARPGSLRRCATR